MNPPGSVAIIGLGLMGGSLARDLSAREVSVLGFDARPEVLASACAEGVIRRALDADLQGIEGVELLVLATPVDAAVEALSRLSERTGPGTVVTDVGSTKVAIAERAEANGLGDRFVGSHPLAGDHRSGWAAARPDLYRHAPVFVCPTPSAADSAVRTVLDLWSSVGAVPSLQSPAEHDRRMATISHLPQILSSALAVQLQEEGIGSHELGPGGRDMTRLAGSSPEMWAAICLANAEHLRAAIQRMQAQLAVADEAIGSADFQSLLDFFRRGASWRTNSAERYPPRSP